MKLLKNHTNDNNRTVHAHFSTVHVVIVCILLSGCITSEYDDVKYPTLIIPKSALLQVKAIESNSKSVDSLADSGEDDSVFGTDVDILNTITFDKKYINVYMHDVKNGRPITQSGVPDYNIYAENISCKRVKYCAKISSTGDSYFYNIVFDEVWSSDGYGGVIAPGNKDGTVGILYIKRLTGDGKMVPHTSYNTNSDGISPERKTEPVYVRYASIKGFSDAAIDNKSTIYIMNANLSGGHRTLRSWNDGGEIIIVNSKVTSASGRVYAWLGTNATSGVHGVIKYYNTTWDGQPHPDPDKVAGAFSNMIALASNPLPAISSFFGDEIQTVTFEYQKNGKKWSSVTNGTFGSSGSALRGDVIFDISLPSGTTHVRASVRMMDNRVLTSAAMPSTGGANTIDLFDFDAYSMGKSRRGGRKKRKG